MYRKKILITGITGFVGSHLVAFLKRHYPCCEIIGISRSQLSDKKDYKFYSVDLLNPDELHETLKSLQPDFIFHLSGLVFSYDWDELYRGNVVATLNLLEAARKIGGEGRIIVAGSSAEYGVISPQYLPVAEAYPSAPQSPYAISKLRQTLLAQYYNKLGVSVVIGRIFNVLGYGAAQQLSTGDFFSQVRRIQNKQQNPCITVGNLQIKRDFLDIDDVCSALIALALQGKKGEIYNICSGVSIKLKTVLDLAIEAAGINVEIVTNKNKSQNIYLEDIYGCNKKIIKDTQWKSMETLESSVRKALNILY